MRAMNKTLLWARLTLLVLLFVQVPESVHAGDFTGGDHLAVQPVKGFGVLGHRVGERRAA